MPEQARLRLHGQGDIELELIIDFLTDFRRAYNSVVVFEYVTEAMYRATRDSPFGFQFSPSADWPVGPRRPFQRYRTWSLETERQLASYVPYPEQLRLSGVELHSPGFWEFLGSANPLEVARKWMNDRHERRKDREYREAAEARRLRLDNLLRENQVIAQRIEMAKSVGATQRDLAPLINSLIRDPLMALDRHQDRGVIGHAELLPPRKDGEKD